MIGLAMKIAPLHPTVPAAQVVAPPYRGRGVSKAIGWYRSLGHPEWGPFGPYAGDPPSFFMEKRFSLFP